MTDQNHAMPPLPDGSTSMPAPVEAGFSPTAVQEPQGNVALGLITGTALGLVAVALYAIVARFTDREIGWLAFLIGFGVAFGMLLVGKRTSIGLGIAAALISAVLFILAIFATSALVIANEYGVPVGDVIDVLMEAPADVVKLYFEDIMSWLFLGLAVVPAFLTASGLRNKSED